MVKDRKSQVCRGPADGLEGEEADEGRQWGVVQTPSGEETSGQAQTLETCQDSLKKYQGNGGLVLIKRNTAPIRQRPDSQCVQGGDGRLGKA